MLQLNIRMLLARLRKPRSRRDRGRVRAGPAVLLHGLGAAASMRVVPRAAAIALAAVAASVASTAWADAASPVGLWENVDDATGKPRAVIRISEAHGTLQGRIEKVFLAPNESPNCVACKGALKNAPILGLMILNGLKKVGDAYSGGEILDPDKGKFYSCKVRLVESGRKLEVRGFIGFSLLGRSQFWRRLE